MSESRRPFVALATDGLFLIVEAMPDRLRICSSGARRVQTGSRSRVDEGCALWRSPALLFFPNHAIGFCEPAITTALGRVNVFVTLPAR